MPLDRTNVTLKFRQYLSNNSARVSSLITNIKIQSFKTNPVIERLKVRRIPECIVSVHITSAVFMISIFIIWQCLTRTGNYRIHEFDWLKSILTAV